MRTRSGQQPPPTWCALGPLIDRSVKEFRVRCQRADADLASSIAQFAELQQMVPRPRDTYADWGVAGERDSGAADEQAVQGGERLVPAVRSDCRRCWKDVGSDNGPE
jgi:hypothetical protein